ncbi:MULTISPECIES: hypothetical protein [Burkholderia]|uniref:hypothetical protein n=1 Tax=Burkholderia TaxID=32008 RepID=UPI000BF8B76A|nr:MULTISPECIES: hypothetical protein [Burkholderia]PFH20520.1 hypothetical protein BX604_4915 [Burkholderia sp. JKS000303]
MKFHRFFSRIGLGFYSGIVTISLSLYGIATLDRAASNESFSPAFPYHGIFCGFILIGIVLVIHGLIWSAGEP